MIFNQIEEGFIPAHNKFTLKTNMSQDHNYMRRSLSVPFVRVYHQQLKPVTRIIVDKIECKVATKVLHSKLDNISFDSKIYSTRR